MTMMISKFHKLIQSKILWIIFAVMIICSFVVWAIPWPARQELAQETRSAGKLFEKSISYEEFRHARANTYLTLVMMYRQQPKMNPELNIELEKSAWRRIASMKQAEKLGITADNAEVVQAIKGQPMFLNEQRQFDPRYYQQFAKGFLRSLGVTEPQFEEYIREEIILQKLRNMVSQALIIPPYEIKRTYDTVNDILNVEYVQITPDTVEDEVEVSDEDIALYFEKNNEDFTIPPKTSVRYIKIPVADFLDQVEVTDDDVLTYYTDHQDDYATTNAVTDSTTTSDEAVDQAIAELDQNQDALSYTPLEDVSEEIKDILTKKATREFASTKATDFVMSLVPDRAGLAPSFEESAEKFGFDVATTAPFSLHETIEGIDAGDDFNGDAFELQDTPNDYFSNAILGSNYVYVIATGTKEPARVPELTEVEDDVREAARFNAIVDAMMATSVKLKDEAEKALEDGKTFGDIAAQYDLEVTIETNLSASAMGDDENPLFRLLIPHVLVYNRGEVTEAIPTEDGLLMAYVAHRAPGNKMASLASLSPQIANAIRRERRSLLFRDMEDYLLKQGTFDDKYNLFAEEEVEVDEKTTN